MFNHLIYEHIFHNPIYYNYNSNRCDKGTSNNKNKHIYSNNNSLQVKSSEKNDHINMPVA